MVWDSRPQGQGAGSPCKVLRVPVAPPRPGLGAGWVQMLPGLGARGWSFARQGEADAQRCSEKPKEQEEGRLDLGSVAGDSQRSAPCPPGLGPHPQWGRGGMTEGGHSLTKCPLTQSQSRFAPTSLAKRMERSHTTCWQRTEERHSQQALM